MPYSIVIAGVDRTTDIISNTLIIEDVVNDQVNTCSFALEDLSGNGIPSTDDEIIITLDTSEILFGGILTTVSTSKNGTITAQINCVDYTAVFDRNLVHKSYENMTDKEIIEDIVATYCAGFGITTTNVIEAYTVDQISFNYIQPSQVLRKLAELTGNSWYIDYEKDIHFFPLTTNAAPFDITDNSVDHDRLTITKDATQLKNRIYVRGGTQLSDSTTYEEKGDGVKTTFILPDKPHTVTVEVNGTPKTLGIKNIDTSGFDWYLNFQEKYLQQDSGGAVLTSSDTLSVMYQYDIPILVAQEDSASIAANGVKEFPIFDKTISTKDAARQRAIAELTDYANDMVSGGFHTFETGFRSGQYININRTDHGVNDDYLIQKVRYTSLGGGKFMYDISIASSKTMGIIRFLIQLLENNRKLIELDDDEVIDELFTLSDSLLSDSLTEALTIDSAGPYRTWAAPVDSSPTRLKWDLGQWK